MYFVYKYTLGYFRVRLVNPREGFSYLRHLFEYIGTQFPPPSSLLYGKMGSITLFFFKWEY